MKKLHILILVILLASTDVQSQSWQFKGATNWTNISTHTMFVDEDTTLHVGISSSGPYHVSTDEGTTFTADNNGMVYVANEHVTEIKRVADTLVLARASFTGGSVWVKHISSGNWINRTSGLSGNSSIAKCLEVIGNAIFLGTKAGVYRSTDNGLTWTNVKLTIAGSSSSSDINDMDVWNDTLYIAGGKRVAYSTDLGTTWTDGQQNSATSINCIAAKGSTVYLHFSGSSQVLKTTDGGSSYSTAWTLPNNNDVKKILIHGNLFFYRQAGNTGTYGGFYYSTDNAQTFSALSSGITYSNSMNCEDMTKTADGILGFWTTDAASAPPAYSGIYKLSYSDFPGVVTGSKSLSLNTIHLPVYPNPATEFITISGMDLIREFNINIVSTDGKIVHSAFTNAATIDVSELKAGLYFIHITDIKGDIRRTKFIKE